MVVYTTVDQRDRLAFDVFIFVFIYVVPGAVVLISYSLTGSRLLTADESLRRQHSPGGADDDETGGQRRHRWQNFVVHSPRRRRHASASPVYIGSQQSMVTIRSPCCRATVRS